MEVGTRRGVVVGVRWVEAHIEPSSAHLRHLCIIFVAALCHLIQHGL